MPVYLFYLLQLFNIGCFGPLKRAYGQLVENKIRLDFNYIDKLNFLEVFFQIRVQIYITSNIYSDFLAIDFIFFNSKHVLSQLNIQLEIISLDSRSSSRSTNLIFKISYNLKQLQKQKTILKKLLRTYIKSFNLSIKIIIKQFFKDYK